MESVLVNILPGAQRDTRLSSINIVIIANIWREKECVLNREDEIKLMKYL